MQFLLRVKSYNTGYKNSHVNAPRGSLLIHNLEIYRLLNYFTLTFFTEEYLEYTLVPSSLYLNARTL